MPSVSKISGKEIKLLSPVWLLILGDIKKLHLKEWFWVLCIQYQSNNNTNGDHEGDEEDCLRHPWPPATPPLCRWLAFCRDIHIHSLRSGPAVPAAPAATTAQPSCRSRELGPRLCSCKNLQRNHTRYLEFSNFYIDTHNIQIKHQLAPSPC